MHVQLLVTQTDFCLPNLMRELEDVGISYSVEYIEDNPELVASHQIRHSPNILINGSLIFRSQPSIGELRTFFLG
ncbi:hypothetical protein CMT41_03165 [Colwellia sp. MT41]|uniref:Thioredoxin-like fold domain-containing protein n=1 Tax=Colwellia marinimaniae TaxID=1513592 RepID=A0ABQ0MXS6_9GAMM|nr:MULTISPECIES: hypothetical protein [Colwellia]ALO33833.1 hypothetical protein CMT41_03165 [Colwellia sp. MT41]GAW97160.1 hypothetical protein MTCD1_02786 [Colwellia marinimaniae]